MSLLTNHVDEQFFNIAQMAFAEQFKRDSKLEYEMGTRQKEIIYDNMVYNISILITAVRLKDERIFEKHAIWVYKRLANSIKNLERDNIRTLMIDHYGILSEILNNKGNGVLSQKELEIATEYLKSAIELTENAVTKSSYSSNVTEDAHYEIQQKYLDFLLNNQKEEAVKVIQEARDRGLPLVEIYDKILAKTMHEVGDLWHRSIITVDKEHYVTAVTQTVMGSFYDEIFAAPRNNKRLVSCAVGSDLHELGIRMLSDLFEQRGWDTYYLGAAQTEGSILKAIGEYEPKLIALSVTMPIHLSACEIIVRKIKETYPNVKIAVGGQAFTNTNVLWKRWKVDYYATNAEEFIEWAENNC